MATSSETIATTAAEWVTPGRKTVEGYLLVVRGGRKRRYYDVLAEFIADQIEATGRELPRWPDCHAVWFGRDETKEPGRQLVKPFLRYKASRPIDGLRRECSGHRVRLACTVTKGWDNGLGAYIVRASGTCLECE